MGKRDYYDNRNQQSEYKKENKEINKRKHLSLDNIMVLRIGSTNRYMITMLGLKQSNCTERILLSNNQKEMAVIKSCIQDSLELERKSIINYMSSDYIKIYNEALRIGNYQYCLTILRGLEAHMNHMSAEKNKLLVKRGGIKMKHLTKEQLKKDLETRDLSDEK